MQRFLDFLDSDEVAIVQDGKGYTRRHLLEVAYGAAQQMRDKATQVELYSNGDIYVLPYLIGAHIAGKSAIVTSEFHVGPIKQAMQRAHKTMYFTGCGPMTKPPMDVVPGGNIGLLSSGTSGAPRLNYNVPLYYDDDLYEQTQAWWDEKTGHDREWIYVTAPIATAAPVYLAMIALGYTVVCSTERQTTEEISAWMPLCSGLSTRPSMLNRLIKEDADFGYGLNFVMSSTADLTQKQVDYCVKRLHAKQVLDAYACTELGTVGLRDAAKGGGFDLLPGVNLLVDHEGEAFMWSPVGASTTGDIVSVREDGIHLVSKSKLKVSGFTIYPPLIAKCIVDAAGVEDAVVYMEDGVLTAEYTGTCYNEGDLRLILMNNLPFYSVPSRLIHTTILRGRSSGNEYSVSNSDA